MNGDQLLPRMPLRDLRVPSAISNHKPLVPRHATGEPNAGVEERGCRRSCESIRFNTSPTLRREFQSSFMWLLHKAKVPSEIGRGHSVARQPQHSTTKGPPRLHLLVMNVTPVSSSMSKPLNWPAQTRSGCASAAVTGAFADANTAPLAAAQDPAEGADQQSGEIVARRIACMRLYADSSAPQGIR